MECLERYTLLVTHPFIEFEVKEFTVFKRVAKGINVVSIQAIVYT